jgi:hypothetical protein
MGLKLILHIELKLCVCMFAYSSRTDAQICTKRSMLILKPKRDFRKVKTPEKAPRIRVPVGVVPVARKLSTLEERRQDQNCLFRRGDYRNKGHNPEQLWVRLPVKIVSVARNLSTIEERRQDQSCFGKEIAGTKVTNPKNCPGFESR